MISQLNGFTRIDRDPHSPTNNYTDEEDETMEDIAAIIKQAADTTVQRALELIRPTTRYLRSKEAARYLGVSPLTLEKWRHLGQGPAFLRVKRLILYDRHDVDAFMARHRYEPDGSPRVFPCLPVRGQENSEGTA